MSDMAILKVKNREFQRAAGDWMRRARQGDTIIIVSSEGPPLTLMAGRPGGSSSFDWENHFEWLKRQPIYKANPVDELRKADKR
jgi:hypothetical protein